MYLFGIGTTVEPWFDYGTWTMIRVCWHRECNVVVCVMPHSVQLILPLLNHGRTVVKHNNWNTVRLPQSNCCWIMVTLVAPWYDNWFNRCFYCLKTWILLCDFKHVSSFVVVAVVIVFCVCLIVCALWFNNSAWIIMKWNENHCFTIK